MSKRNEFGFTNEREEFDRVVAWRDAAVADGWSIKPTYGSEAQDRASSLDKNGFHASILTREANHRFKYEAQVSVWGPDGMAIKPPDVYDWEAIRAGVTSCTVCVAKDVKTHRYSFAGRCCEKCLPSMRAKHERPGWNN